MPPGVNLARGGNRGGSPTVSEFTAPSSDVISARFIALVVLRVRLAKRRIAGHRVGRVVLLVDRFAPNTPSLLRPAPRSAHTVRRPSSSPHLIPGSATVGFPLNAATAFESPRTPAASVRFPSPDAAFVSGSRRPRAFAALTDGAHEQGTPRPGFWTDAGSVELRARRAGRDRTSRRVGEPALAVLGHLRVRQRTPALKAVARRASTRRVPALLR